MRGVPLTPPATHGLGGRFVAGGQRSRQALSRLLGIDDAGQPYEVTAVAWVNHALEAEVRTGDATAVVFRLERRGPESRGLVVTDHLNVYSRGTSMPAGLAEAVSASVTVRLATHTMDALARIIERDADRGTPGLPMPAQPDEQPRPASLLDTWGAEDSWADFFAGGEMARSQLDSIDPSKLFHFVQHCDAECLYVNPHSIGRVATLVNFPWDNRVREPSRPFDQAMGNLADGEFLAEGMITTNLEEDDVIRGNPRKLETLLDYATSRPGHETKTLFVSNTCVPTVIGEDVESLVKRTRERTGQEVLYLTVTPRSMNNVFSGMLTERRLEAERVAPDPDPNTINLIGFGGQRARDEIEEVLTRVGIVVNARLLPELSPGIVDVLPRASLNVFHPNDLWQNLYDQLMAASRTPAIALPAPYGFEATRAWVTSVAEALEHDVDAEPERLAEAWADRWESLRERAGRHRLGFVVRDQEAHYLTTPASTWGIPVLRVCEEMGFGLDVLIRATDKRETRRTAQAIQALFREPSRHTILAFNDFTMLRKRLRASEAEAFLTYHFFDWRLSEAGKGAFSLQHFEMGFAGAIRTLTRLLRVVRTPFYRAYHRFLRRTGAGLWPTDDDAVDAEVTP